MVLERSGHKHRVKEKDGSIIFEFQDCPHHTDHDGHHHECSAIVRPDGSFAGHCFHDEGTGWDEMKTAIGWDDHIRGVRETLGIQMSGPPYEATSTGIIWFKSTAHGVTRVPLCNFTAKIVADCCEHDGLETRRVFEIEAKINNTVKRFSIPATEFAAMNWPLDNLGPEANIYAGHGLKEHVRCADSSP